MRAEHKRGDHRRDDPEPHFGVPEDGVRRRHGDVAARHEPRAAAEGVALHARHDGSRARVDGLEHAVEPHRVLDVLVEREVDRRTLPFDVGAGAEALPFAGQHDAASVAHVRERVGERGDERRVERVAAVGARQRHAEDATVAVDVQARFTHAQAGRNFVSGLCRGPALYSAVRAHVEAAGSSARGQLIVYRATLCRQLREQRLDLAKDVGLLVAEIVEIGVDGGVQQPQLVVRQFDRVHGGTLTDPPRGLWDGRGGRGRPVTHLRELRPVDDERPVVDAQRRRGDGGADLHLDGVVPCAQGLAAASYRVRLG